MGPSREIVRSPRSVTKMASPADIDVFHSALEQALNNLSKTGLKLKEGQYEALKSMVVDARDTVCVLPTGYGKSLIYQLLPNVLDFYCYRGNQQTTASVIVVSPLNALMEDQISKVEGNVKVMKVTDDAASLTNLKVPPQILFAHPEVLLENRKIFSEVLRSKVYKEHVKAMVVDEAHLIVEW